MNAGLPLVDPTGGFYYVFITGTPLVRKYDSQGTLLFERHVEGRELDAYLAAQPKRWPRRRVQDKEVPFVTPTIRTAAVSDAANCGSLSAFRTPTSTTGTATRYARCSSRPRVSSVLQPVVRARTAACSSPRAATSSTRLKRKA